MVDVPSNAGYDRPPPPVTIPSATDLPEIEIPAPASAAGERTHDTAVLPPSPRRPTTKTHELLVPRRRRRFLPKILLFSIIGFGLGILIGVAFLLG